jgi:hypothetical protein
MPVSKHPPFLKETRKSLTNSTERIDPDDPKELQGWVSICAFEANLDALNVFTVQPPYVWMTMDAVFGQPRKEADHSWHPHAPGVERPYRDAFIMGAAQWIIWDGQNLYRRALYRVQLSEDPIGWLGLFWELRPVLRAVSGAVLGARDYVICALMW